MISKFFIDRPVFASVISIIIVLAGLLAMRALPISQYPEIIPPEVSVNATYPKTGKIIMSSQNVDLRTGTVQIRSVFPNADGGILPGQFVRLILKGITLPKAIVIPQQAVSQGPQGTFVYVVNGTGAAEMRPVRLDREVNGGWVVRDGLKEGDQIIVEGVMRVRPGAAVKASPLKPKQEADAKPANASAGAAKQ